MLAGVALLVGEPIEVARVFDLAPSLPASRVNGDLFVAIEDAHGEIGGDEGERLPGMRVRDRVVVSVEAQVGGFPGATDLDEVAAERMGGQRQEPRPLVEEGGGDGALVVVSGDSARMRDARSPVVELAIEVLEGMERPSGEEGVAEVADGALDAALLVSAGARDGP